MTVDGRRRENVETKLVRDNVRPIDVCVENGASNAPIEAGQCTEDLICGPSSLKGVNDILQRAPPSESR